MNKAINIDEPIAYITVSDKGLNISPTKPSINKRGSKTTNVVVAPVMLAMAISLVPSMAAATISLFLFLWVTIFSTTTMDASTTNPMLSINAERVTISSFMPENFIRANVVKKTKGIDKETTSD
ncbi:hypothetical protein DSECCO2_483070 [anaerobic digester metagenome]